MSEGQNPPPWPEQPEGGVPDRHPPADLLARFLARLIDGILIGIVVTIIVVSIVFGGLFGADTGSPFTRGADVAGFFASVVSTVLTIAYFAWFESDRGQTPGKMVMKIVVRGPGGGHPSLEAAVKRNLWMALSIVPFIGSLAQLLAAIAIAVTINANRNGAGWHDEFAGGTRVVKV